MIFVIFCEKLAQKSSVFVNYLYSNHKQTLHLLHLLKQLFSYNTFFTRARNSVMYVNIPLRHNIVFYKKIMCFNLC
jgi:hypothetical protein